MKLEFFKYQGTGNDFVLLNNLNANLNLSTTQIKQLCDRKFGIGADGLILLEQHPQLDYFMKYYNSDGNQSTMCGNGGRCIAAFAIHQKIAKKHHTFMAIDGPHEVIILEETNQQIWLKLKMKDVNTITKSKNNFELNTGSPHYVSFTEMPVNQIELIKLAKEIRYNEYYSKEGINVNFVTLNGEKSIEMRTYERGVEDETLSCGTGVTAAAISTALYNSFANGQHQIKVNTPGGELISSFIMHNNGTLFSDVWLEGPADFVYQGIVEI